MLSAGGAFLRRARERIGLYLEFSRPFTLLPPLVGFVSGSVTAFGAVPPLETVPWGSAALGAFMAATLNAASNGLNQICDLEIDRIAKPHRPLPSGRLGPAAARRFTGVTWALALGAAWFVDPAGGRECFLVVVAASAFVWAYSAPPLRTKRLGMLANLTIAIPRGLLLKVAGWSALRSVLAPEPWFIGAVFGLFLLGATTTKDFSDLEGDRAGGCRTLPIRYGPRGAARRIAPFFVLPFLLIPVGARAGILTGDPLLLDLLGLSLALYGGYIAFLLLRRPDELATDRNHVSWKHMYLLMMAAQVGFAAAYL